MNACTHAHVKIHHYRDRTEGYQWRVSENGEKVQGRGSIIGRYKVERSRLRIVWEMEKPKNLYV